ncbi:unnamed protein product [Lymnaea stagnalis]|uniref:FYVE-type domain-containing protein n=1 Tax=Lymnaea stagnalis TaxID=6523 RepID=A0AAV2H0W7_LYMST
MDVHDNRLVQDCSVLIQKLNLQTKTDTETITKHQNHFPTYFSLGDGGARNLLSSGEMSKSLSCLTELKSNESRKVPTGYPNSSINNSDSYLISQSKHGKPPPKPTSLSLADSAFGQHMNGVKLPAQTSPGLTSYTSTLPAVPLRSSQNHPDVSRRMSQLPDVVLATTLRQTASIPSSKKPPVLPPPPAAHLPPSLPSRPPAAAPRFLGSPSQFIPYRSDSCLSSRGPSNLSTPETKRRSRPNFPNLNTLFRSSGTIKIGNAPTPIPPSPPPLTRLQNSPTETSNLKTAVHTPLNSIVPTIEITPAPIMYITTSSSVSSTSSDVEDDVEFVHDSDVASISECDSQKIPQDEIFMRQSCHELVKCRSRSGWFFKKKTSTTTESWDVKQNIFPPELDSIRNRSMSVADVITNALVVYRMSKSVTKGKKMPSNIQANLPKPRQCSQCGRPFGILSARYNCASCKKCFCERCIQLCYDTLEQNETRPSELRICGACRDEVDRQSCRGATRGLWSEFLRFRAEARAEHGKPLTTLNPGKQPELPNMLDVSPGLQNLCLEFMTELHHQLEKQSKNSFLSSYLHLNNTGQRHNKQSNKKVKECQSCRRPLSVLTEIRDCALCDKPFCIMCIYKTLQLYLPLGTDLKGHLDIQQIKFHVLADKQNEIEGIEASETYRVCVDCEDLVGRNLKILEFNNKIVEVEQEMFDLQRQIDHALSYDPHFYRMQRSRSAMSINHMTELDDMTGNLKMANKLYDRYTRTYDSLTHMAPETQGQKALHKHIKQAMYEFYLKRRSQLRSSLRRRDSCLSLNTDLR